MAGLGSILITAGRRLINVYLYICIILSTENKIIICDCRISSFRGLWWPCVIIICGRNKNDNLTNGFLTTTMTLDIVTTTATCEFIMMVDARLSVRGRAIACVYVSMFGVRALDLVTGDVIRGANPRGLSFICRRRPTVIPLKKTPSRYKYTLIHALNRDGALTHTTREAGKGCFVWCVFVFCWFCALCKSPSHSVAVHRKRGVVVAALVYVYSYFVNRELTTTYTYIYTPI